jgi:hypothetical protein
MNKVTGIEKWWYTNEANPICLLYQFGNIFYNDPLIAKELLHENVKEWDVETNQSFVKTEDVNTVLQTY